MIKITSTFDHLLSFVRQNWKDKTFSYVHLCCFTRRWSCHLCQSLCLRCTCCHSSTKIVVFLRAPRELEVRLCVCVCLCARKRAVCLRVPRSALFEFTFTNGCTNSRTVRCCGEFSGVCLSNSNFAMTGLLSVFSLLPVQALKTREDIPEQIEEEEDAGRPGLKHEDGCKLSSQDDGETNTDTER